MVTSLQQIGTVTRCCRRHYIIRSVSYSPMHSYIKTPLKQNLFDVMALYHRASTFNLSLHLFVMPALLPKVAHSYSLYSRVRINSSKTAGIIPFCCRKYADPGTGAKNNATFSMHCLIFLLVSNTTIWLYILLLCAGDIQPNHGPMSTASSSGSFFASGVSTVFFLS